MTKENAYSVGFVSVSSFFSPFHKIKKNVVCQCVKYVKPKGAIKCEEEREIKKTYDEPWAKCVCCF